MPAEEAANPSRSLNCETASDHLLAERLKALGHPVRLAMVHQLAERDRCCCNDFCACLGLAQSTISQHLDVLCRAGLVSRKADGTKSLFHLEHETIHLLSKALMRLPSTASRSRDRKAVR